MSNQQTIILVVVIAVVFVISSGVYTIDETEQVIITQFGRPVGDALTQPGIHFKIPFIQVANRFDNRFLEWDGDANQIPTRDKCFLTRCTAPMIRATFTFRLNHSGRSSGEGRTAVHPKAVHKTAATTRKPHQKKGLLSGEKRPF